MKWISIAFITLLLVGMLLGFNSVAYADDPPDLGVTIDIQITDGEVQILINGVELGARTHGGGVGLESLANKMGVTKMKKDLAEISDYLNLTGAAVAKVIVLSQNNEEEIEVISAEIFNHIPTTLGNHEAQIVALESDATYQLGRIEALEAQDKAIIAYITATKDYLKADYDRKLVTIAVLFSVVIIGLAISLALLWRRVKII